MIQEIWEKKIVAIIQLSQDDFSDWQNPMPLIINMNWNSYIGFYYDIIKDYFQMYAPFPIRRQQFHLTIQHTGSRLSQEDIVYHLIDKFKLNLNLPLLFRCHFRSKQILPQIDLRRHFKNNLKASTALKYGKYGAAILTVQMSINNVQNMFTSFMNNQYTQFLGSSNFQSDNLGYNFLIHRAEKVAVKFIFNNQFIERSAGKDISFAQFAESVFGNENINKLTFKLHMVEIINLQTKMADLEKYCHPDGYLYIHI